MICLCYAIRMSGTRITIVRVHWKDKTWEDTASKHGYSIHVLLTKHPCYLPSTPTNDHPFYLPSTPTNDHPCYHPLQQNNDLPLTLLIHRCTTSIGLKNRSYTLLRTYICYCYICYCNPFFCLRNFSLPTYLFKVPPSHIGTAFSTLHHLHRYQILSSVGGVLYLCDVDR
jgi:hypothetical protein